MRDTILKGKRCNFHLGEYNRKRYWQPVSVEMRDSRFVIGKESRGFVEILACESNLQWYESRFIRFRFFSCGGEQGIGHDSDGFIADERAMGVYHFCLDQRLTAPRTAKKQVFYLLNRRLASPNSEKNTNHFCLD